VTLSLERMKFLGRVRAASERASLMAGHIGATGKKNRERAERAAAVSAADAWLRELGLTVPHEPEPAGTLPSTGTVRSEV
jgi:hypothetical protein